VEALERLHRFRQDVALFVAVGAAPFGQGEAAQRRHLVAHAAESRQAVEGDHQRLEVAVVAAVADGFLDAGGEVVVGFLGDAPGPARLAPWGRPAHRLELGLEHQPPTPLAGILQALLVAGGMLAVGQQQPPVEGRGVVGRVEEQPGVGTALLAAAGDGPPRQADVVALGELGDQRAGALGRHPAANVPVIAAGDGRQHRLHGAGLAQVDPHELGT